MRLCEVFAKVSQNRGFCLARLRAKPKVTLCWMDRGWG